MSRILNRIRTEFDFDSYVHEYYDVKEATNGELRVCCPFCGNDKYKLYVNVDKRLFNCYACEFKTGKYDCVDFVAVTEGISRAKAQAKLIKEYRELTPDDDIFLEIMHDQIVATKLNKTVVPIREIVLPSQLKRLTNGAGVEAEAWQYLSARGFTAEEIRATQAYYCTEANLPVLNQNGKEVGNLAHRVLWPVFGEGKLVSWIARDIPGIYGNQKYLVCPDSDMKRTLWPHIIPTSKHAVLVEGLVDCVAVRRVSGSVYATWGKAISDEQIFLLKDWGIEEVTLFWDKKDAKKEMIRAIDEKLSMRFKNVYVCDMSLFPRNVDPGKCLELPDGTAMLSETLNKRISIYDTIGYGQWMTSF